MKSLSALRALNAARRSGASASDLELAIDAADRSCGYDRRDNRPVRGPLPPLTHVRGNQTFNGRPGRSWPHQPACLCMVCGNLVRARLRLLAAQGEIAAGAFDVRRVLHAARALAVSARAVSPKENAGRDEISQGCAPGRAHAGSGEVRS